MSCIFCMGYLALNYDAYGEKIETQEYKDLAQKLRDKWSKKS